MSTQPSRLSEFWFEMGKFMGSLSRPEMKEYFVAEGLKPEEHEAILRSLDPLVAIAYKDNK